MLKSVLFLSILRQFHARPKTGLIMPRPRRPPATRAGGSKSVLAVVSGPAGTDRVGHRCPSAGSNRSLSDAMHLTHRSSHLSALPTTGTGGLVGFAAAIGPTAADFPPCNGRRSYNWHVWSRWPGDCISATGRVPIWRARRGLRVSSRRSRRARFGAFCGTWICNRIGLDIGKRPAGMPSSSIAQSRSCGAMEMLNDWLNRAFW